MLKAARFSNAALASNSPSPSPNPSLKTPPPRPALPLLLRERFHVLSLLPSFLLLLWVERAPPTALIGRPFQSLGEDTVRVF